MHTLWSMSLQFWFRRSVGTHHSLSPYKSTHSKNTENRTWWCKLGTNTVTLAATKLADFCSPKKSAVYKVHVIEMSSLVRTYPVPGPGPLRSNTASIQSWNISGPDSIHAQHLCKIRWRLCSIKCSIILLVAIETNTMYLHAILVCCDRWQHWTDATFSTSKKVTEEQFDAGVHQVPDSVRFYQVQIIDVPLNRAKSICG